MNCRDRQNWRTELIVRDKQPQARDWLRDRGSLTKRLQALGTFSIVVLQQNLATPTVDELATLNLKPKHRAWVREVVLACDGKPVVFAHTILPRQPRGPLTGWLQRLGNRSLGALLFSHAGFSRSTIEYKRINHRHELFRPAVQSMQLDPSTQTLWARRSLFFFGRQYVLVTEIFSPTLTAHPIAVPHKKTFDTTFREAYSIACLSP